MCEDSQGGVTTPSGLLAGLVKRSNTADCKSAGLCLRRFESYTLHQSLALLESKCTLCKTKADLTHRKSNNKQVLDCSFCQRVTGWLCLSQYSYTRFLYR
jgi:hypothetical protein